MMRRVRAFPAAICLALLASACGRVVDLKPVPPNTLPPPPYGATEPPSAEELLRTSPMATPERSVELRSESEEREDDPFDLPPD